MSLQRRFELLQAAAQAGAWIIEDDYDGEFSFGGPPLPTLKSVDATGLVIHVGTFSKSLFPSLRLGYLLAPPALVEPLDAIMSRLMHGVPTHTQAVVADFIGEGHFAAHIRRMRRLYAERHEALCSAAAAQLGGALEVERSSSGLHTVGWLRAGHDEAAVVAAAAQRQVTVSPIARYAMRRAPPVTGRAWCWVRRRDGGRDRARRGGAGAGVGTPAPGLTSGLRQKPKWACRAACPCGNLGAWAPSTTSSSAPAPPAACSPTG